MIDIPKAEVEECRAFCANWMLRRLRLDFQKKWLVRLIRTLSSIPYAPPSSLRKFGLSAETSRVTANGRSVGVRIIRPKESPQGLIVDVHGGAWTIGRPVQNDLLNGRLAQARFAVISVDYRYAPENPFREVIDDCETALSWALAEGERAFGVSDVLLHGDSAGAHLSLAAALRCRTSNLDFHRLKGMALYYGCYDLSATPSVRAATRETLVLYGPSLAAFLERITGGLSDAARRDPSISPLYADLAGLPPALLIVGTADPLVDDSTMLADKLRAQGVNTELVVVPDAPHGFNRFPIALADRVNAYACEWMTSKIHKSAA
jgi:acetyl esterase/lipase